MVINYLLTSLLYVYPLGYLLFRNNIIENVNKISNIIAVFIHILFCPHTVLLTKVAKLGLRVNITIGIRVCANFSFFTAWSFLNSKVIVYSIDS